MKQFGFSIHFRFTLIIGKHLASILIFYGKKELSIDIVNPRSWKYISHMESDIKRIGVKIK